MVPDRTIRCSWATAADPRMRDYHDREWGVPKRSGRALWENLMLDGFQAGLSWRTVLHKREALREAFDGFDPEIVAGYTERDVRRRLADPRIIRSRAKILSTIAGARAFVAMERGGTPFARFAWSFVGGRTILGPGWAAVSETALSRTIATALRARGFRFVGPVIVYAWMQACGLVNDHAPGCFRRRALGGRPAGEA
ncbi:MAG: DNA-3-methyladenine glycosylase I [Thermoplasmata archaeon]